MTAELLVPHTVAKSVLSVFGGELNHKQTLIRLQLPPFISEQPFLCRELPWFGSTLPVWVAVCWWPAQQPRHQDCPCVLLCPNALPQLSSHPSAISVLTSSTCSLIRGECSLCSQVYGINFKLSSSSDSDF